jgi:arginine deiminase
MQNPALFESEDFLSAIQHNRYMLNLGIDSEIGRLKRVIIHSPGPEIEAMKPRDAEQDLYNDIIPLDAVRKEYSLLKTFLETIAQVYELTELLADCLKDIGYRFEFLSDLSRYFPIRVKMDALMALPAEELASLVIEGIPSPKNSLAQLLDPNSFISRPLPNTYFMRDSAAVVGDCLISAATAFDVRMVEALITRFIFTHHAEYMVKTIIFDGPSERNRYVTAEGGDIQVLAPDVLAIGISERTTAFAVERIAQNAARISQRPVTVFAVELPRQRATIHLDMVFTMVDKDAALIYGPVIQGPNRCRVFKIEVEKGGKLHYQEEDSLLQGLSRCGIDLEPVLCGQGHPIYQEREQWLSGANSFAFAPGKILTYSCNTHTTNALADAGFAIRPAEAFISGKDIPDNYARLAVTFDGIELARGGGGARCMTLPVERDSLDCVTKH